MPEQIARSAAEERGVYKSWWKIDGCYALYAVTSRGERMKKIIVLRPGISEERAVQWFEELLDRVDPPRPKLALIAPAGVRQLTVEQVDALYQDASPVAAELWRRKRDRARGLLSSSRVILITRPSRDASDQRHSPSS